MPVTPYLMFNGRCEEALNFYKKALCAEVGMLMRFKESPEPPPPGCAPVDGNKIMHSAFQIGGATVMASDGMAQGGPKFEGFSLTIHAKDEPEADRLFAGLSEIVFAWILGASDTFKTTVFIVGLLFGKSITWGGQARDAHGIPWSLAAQNLWPQTLFGVLVVGLMAMTSIQFALWSLPLTLGFLVAIPFAVLTADPGFGLWLTRRGLYAIPEEIEKPDIVVRAQMGEGH